jgi:peptide/nickel transport system substrate-binding protein
MQSQLQSQGVTLEPTFLGVAEWKQRVWRDREFDVILSQWTFDRNEDIYEQFHSSGTRNFVAYENTDVDRLLDEARVATDPQQKKALLREVHLRVANDTPMVFLWTLDSYSALSTSVKNVVVHPFYFFTWATDWTTE